MEWLTLILAILAVPFLIGYLVGKKSSKDSGSDNGARLQGQREVRNYILGFLASQPATIKKADLLKEMGASEADSRQAKTSAVAAVEAKKYSPDPVIKQDKPKNEDQNINVILYVASFLLVGAAVLFIGTNVYDGLKFVGAWGISIGFYIAGLIIYRFSIRLRPAAVAFVGTGLALLPFAGLATNLFVLHNPELSWFITSLIGLVAFLYATVQLRSQVLAYLTLGFVFSLTTSSVAVLQAPLVWSFVLVILVGSVLNLLAFVRPKALPEVFLRPIDDSAQLAVPLAVFGSWLTTNQLPLWQHGTILAVTALHYTLSALRPAKLSYRQPYIFVARAAAMSAILVFTYDYSRSWESVGWALTILATLQVIISAAVVKIKSNSYDIAWLWIGMILQVFAITCWSGVENRPALTTESLSLVLVTSLLISWYVNRSRYAVSGVFAVAILVLQVGTDLIVPRVEDYVLATVFVIISALALVVRVLWCQTGERLNIAASACVLYGILAICLSFGIPSIWQTVVFLGLGLIAAAASHVEKQPNFYILANILLFMSSYVFTDTLQLENNMRLIIAAWISGGVFYIARIYFGSMRDKLRSDISMTSTIVVLISVGGILVFDTPVVPAAITLIIGSALMYWEAILNKQQFLKEVAVLIATLALQRLVANSLDLDTLVYTHWWAAVLIYLAALRYRAGDKSNASNWLIVGLIFISLPSGLAALGDPLKYQMLFLLEHVALLIAGGLTNYRLATVWGAVGVALSVLYWLKDYTYLLVGLIGLALIGLAIWRLLSKDTK